MKNLREEIGELVKKSADFSFDLDLNSRMEQAILQAIRLVLEREPSEMLWRAASLVEENFGSGHALGPTRYERIYRAMTAELLKELEK